MNNGIISQENTQNQKLTSLIPSSTVLTILAITCDLMTFLGSLIQGGIILFIILLGYSLKEKNPNLKSISLIGFFIFLSFFVAQKLYGAEDKGFLETEFKILTAIQQKLVSIETKLDELIEHKRIQEDEITIISPYTNAKVTGKYNRNYENECFTLYDQGDRFYQTLDHKNTAENLERMLREEGPFSSSELAELHCRLGFRLMHINQEQAAKHYESALMFESNNIGALLGLAMINPGVANIYLEKAYIAAENEKKANAFPYITLVDYSKEIPKIKLNKSNEEATIKLIESGIEISKILNIQRMVDRFQQIRIENQIRKSNPDHDQIKNLLQQSFSNCNLRPIYMDQIRCHYFRGVLFHTYLNDKSEAKNELNEALRIAIRKRDIHSELYLEFELLNLIEYDLPWREHEKKLEDLLKKAENLGNWDILQLIWNKLAQIASYKRQNPKLALERMTESIKYIEINLDDNSPIKKSLLLMYLPHLANSAGRANEKEIQIETLERIVKISEEIGSKFSQLIAQSSYISAFASQLGLTPGDSFSLDIEKKLAHNLQKFSELDSLFISSIIQHDTAFFGIARPKENYQQFKKNDSFYCIDKFGQAITPKEEYNCLKEHAFDTINKFLNQWYLLVLNDRTSESYYYHLMHTVEKMLTVRKRLSDLQDLSFLYLVKNPTYEWQLNEVKKKAKDNEANLESLMHLEQIPEEKLYLYSHNEIFELIKFAVDSDKKETAEKILEKIENYWRSGRAEAYKWNSILSNLIDSYHYIKNTEKELSYLCTAYVQSYSDEAGNFCFDEWRRPFTLIKIIAANNEIIESKLSNKYIENSILLEEYTKLCLIDLVENDNSGDANICKESLPAIFARTNPSLNLDEEILYAKRNLYQVKEKINLKFCEEFLIEQLH